MRKIWILHKTFANKHRFHPTSQREQNSQFLINWHYKSLRKVGEATEYNNFRINYLRLRASRRNMHFYFPLFALTLFRTSQKPQVNVKTFLGIKGFLLEICLFHHLFLMRYFKMRIKIGWWKHSYCNHSFNWFVQNSTSYRKETSGCLFESLNHSLNCHSQTLIQVRNTATVLLDDAQQFCWAFLWNHIRWWSKNIKKLPVLALSYSILR